jgi:hypothetical protein
MQHLGNNHPTSFPSLWNHSVFYNSKIKLLLAGYFLFFNGGVFTRQSNAKKMIRSTLH